MEIREIIVGLLKKYKLSESEICRRCSMNPSQLSSYLNQTNKKDIQVSTLMRIIESFPVDAQSEFWWTMNARSIKKASENQRYKDELTNAMKLAETSSEYIEI